MTIEHRKQLCRLLCDELNVKKYGVQLCFTEKGVVKVVYDRDTDNFSYTLDGVNQINEVAPEVLEELFK